MAQRISFLTGKPIRPGTVLSELHSHLQSLRSDVAIHVVTDAVLPSPLLDSTLIVQRALGPPQLSAALRLEEAGIRCCNGITATIAVRHRALTLQSLVPYGVRVPTTTLAESWEQVLDQADQAPVVVKTATELTGRGRGVLKAANGALPPKPPFTGPYLIQEFITCDSRDYKVYVVGGQ